MLTLIDASAILTDQYVEMLFAEVRLAEQGEFAMVGNINAINALRMEINLADETLRYQLSQMP